MARRAASARGAADRSPRAERAPAPTAARAHRWLVTRAAEDAEAELGALREAGLRALGVPCVAFESLPWPRWRATAGEPLYVLTSRRAARAWLAAGEGGALLAATAPQTAALLDDAAAPVLVRALGGALGLAVALRDAWRAAGEPRWALRYPTSDAGEASPEQARALDVLAAVGPVERRVVYRTKAPRGLGRALGAALREPWSVTFHSPSAVAAFLAHRPAAAPPPAHVVCVGASTARAWQARRARGWPTAVESSHAVHTVLSLEPVP